MKKNQLRDQNGRFIREPYYVSFKPSDKTISGNVECVRMDNIFRFFYDMFNTGKRCMAEDIFEDKMASMPEFYIEVPMPVHDIEIHIDGPDDLSPVCQCKVAEDVWCPRWIVDLTWFGVPRVKGALGTEDILLLDEDEPDEADKTLKDFMKAFGLCLFGLILAFVICAILLAARSL